MTETVMWGERGLVATFFIDLSADASLRRWKNFFRSVQFAGNGSGLDWEKIVKVWAVVEPSFGVKGFGLPDLVARAEFEDGSAAGIFLEAKTGVYAENTLDPLGRFDAKKFNSTLNGQLELNHRLTLALEGYAGTGRLIEPAWVAQTPYLGTGAPRYVGKPSVLKKLVPQLRGPAVQRYLHIAVTSDESTPLTGKLGGYLPQVFLGPDAGDLWAGQCGRFGWIGWSILKQQAEPGTLFLRSHTLNEDYLSRETAVPGTLPTAWPSNRPQVGVSVVFVPSFDPDTRDTVVHFSWSGNTCVLRNYRRPGSRTDPSIPPPTYLKTLEVLPLIVKEKRFGRARPPLTDAAAWLAITDETNASWGLHPTDR